MVGEGGILTFDSVLSHLLSMERLQLTESSKTTTLTEVSTHAAVGRGGGRGKERTSSRRIYPPSVHYGQENYLCDRCWQKFPHLHPQATVATNY